MTLKDDPAGIVLKKTWPLTIPQNAFLLNFQEQNKFHFRRTGKAQTSPSGSDRMKMLQPNRGGWLSLETELPKEQIEVKKLEVV